MGVLKLVLLGFALIGLLCSAVLNIMIAVLSREIPNLPLSVRINPFNVLAHQDRWTPEMRETNRWAVRAMLVLVASVSAYLGVGLIQLAAP